jgi:hypothetical protein
MPLVSPATSPARTASKPDRHQRRAELAPANPEGDDDDQDCDDDGAGARAAGERGRGDGMVYPIEAGWPACMSREAYGQLMEAFREGGTGRAVSVGGCGQTRSGTVRVIE